MAEVTLSPFPADLVAPAARDGIKVNELDGCEWVVATDAGHRVGVVGVHRYGTRQRYARIRAVWLDPAHRGTGLGAYMTDFAIALAAAHRGVVRLDVFAINPRFYLERGWTLSPRPSGNRSPQLTLDVSRTRPRFPDRMTP